MDITLEKACDLLENGQVVAIPTETVYGLAASLSHSEAIERIFTLKGRPAKNPLIVHVADMSQVSYYSREIPEDFDKLARAFWPGPLTMVIPSQPEWVPTTVRAGLPTVAFRIPSHPLTLQVLNRVGPLVMPSANLSGKPSATRPEHVEVDFGEDFPILNGGNSLRGLESTILFHRKDRWEICRLGALTPEAFTPILGYEPTFYMNVDQNAPVSPGQLLRHYAPRTKLTLSNSIPEIGSGTIVGFSDRNYPGSFRVLALGPVGNPEKIAENLYSVLRQLDEEDIKDAWVDMNFPREGLWRTVAERLQTASAEQL
jgi:L-threonylcarbamoyladenylate synthase